MKKLFDLPDEPAIAFDTLLATGRLTMTKL